MSRGISAFLVVLICNLFTGCATTQPSVVKPPFKIMPVKTDVASVPEVVLIYKEPPFFNEEWLFGDFIQSFCRQHGVKDGKLEYTDGSETWQRQSSGDVLVIDWTMKVTPKAVFDPKLAPNFDAYFQMRLILTVNGKTTVYGLHNSGYGFGPTEEVARLMAIWRVFFGVILE